MARVLIIEDDPDVTTLLEELLRQEGFDPTTAGDGLEGLLKLRMGEADVVLLDIMMPDLDGTRVLRQLVEEGDGHPEVPVIVMTGSPEGAADARRVIGRENVFEKPFDPSRLMARVRALAETGDAT